MTVFQAAVPTWVGLARFVVVPSPTSPSVFLPQHQSVSLLRIPHVWSKPVATVFQVAVPIWTGLN